MGIQGLETFIREGGQNISIPIDIRNEIAEWRR